MTQPLPEEKVTEAMLAVIATGNYSEAARRTGVSFATVRKWCNEMYAPKFERLREEWGPRIEERLANDLLDNARLAAEVEREAIERSREMLRSGKVQEPSRMARDLSQVRTQAVDKRLALQGRPTQITEKREVKEIVRALQGMGVVEVIDGEAQEVQACLP